MQRICCRDSAGAALGRGIFLLLGILLSASAAIAGDNLPLLTNVAEIKRLTSQDAARGLPVRLRGVVTFHNRHKDCFLQSDGEGIFVERQTQSSVLRAGDYVEIEGVTGAGDYAPIVSEVRSTVVGCGDLPLPRKVDFDQLASGDEDCRWVEIQGLVRSASIIPDSHVHVQLASGGGQVRIYLYDYPLANVPGLVDSVVRVRGAVGGSFNQKRQFVAPLLFAGAGGVSIVEAAATDPFSLPARPIATLLQFDPGARGARRVKVRGVVTHQQLEDAVFVREGGQGLRVQTSQHISVRPGEVVDALGFPVMGVYSPVLQDAVVRPVNSSGEIPVPVSLTARRVLDGDHDADLVRLEAELVDSVRRGEERVLVLQEQDVIFNALIAEPKSGLEWLRKGARVQVTGICLVQEVKEYVSKLTPRSFRILLRSPSDIVVLRQPSWWTAARLAWASGALSLAIVLALSWVWVLRRKVREQTAILRQRVHREAALEERTRIAREFHDTLEQELVGITMQIDAVMATLRHAPELATRSLEVARQMVRRSLTEVHRSVWDLRSPALENGGLASAIVDVTRSITEAAGVRIQVGVTGTPVRLPRVSETHLLRIAQEAINNTVKHAQASRIEVRLHYSQEKMRLCIEDDGRGFDPHAPNERGHFGLLGIEERARKIGGTLEVTSAPGRGTRIEVELPPPELNEATVMA